MGSQDLLLPQSRIYEYIYIKKIIIYLLSQNH